MELGAEVVAACAETRHRLRRPHRRAGVRRPDVAAAPRRRPCATGARIVHACGFDSIPHDLGALFTVRQLPDDVPITMSGFVRAPARSPAAPTTRRSGRSPGFASRRRSRHERRKARSERSARADGRRVRALPHRPVTRTGRPRLGAPAAHHRPGRGAAVGASTAGLRPGLQLRPLRAGTQPADGGRCTRRAGWDGGCRAGADRDGTCSSSCARRGPGRRPSNGERMVPGALRRRSGRIRCSRPRSAGGDPGYDETATMLAQSALCLALDELPALAGQLTTAQAMGVTLQHRLQAQGMSVQGAGR